MNYETLKAAVADVIKTNGNEEITGQLLQDVLIAIINALGSGYQFMGIATTETTPGTPDQRVFYLAGSAGSTTLPGFSITVDHEICVLMYSDEWEKQTLLQFDSALTSGSQKLVTSGMVYDAVTNLSQAINDLAQTVGDHTTAINNLGLAVDAIQAAIESLQTDVAQKIDKSDADSLVVGSAQGVLATSAVEAFFLFQQSGATGNGAALIPTIKGQTIVWNQLVLNGDFASTTGWSTINGSLSITGGNCVFTFSNAGEMQVYRNIAVVSGHKYLLGQKWANKTRKEIITASATTYEFNFRAVSGQVGDTAILYYGYFIDLTLMFGAGFEPSTVAEFETLYPLPYYAYNLGVLKNNDAVAMITDGRNQWDEEWEVGNINQDGEEVVSTTNIRAKNYIPVSPSTAYYAAMLATTPAMRICAYDADKNFISVLVESLKNSVFNTPANCAYLRFGTTGGYGTTYNYDICINISDPSFNGTYEPYWSRTSNLGLTGLTGIPEGGTEDDRVTIFLDGPGGAGSAFDSIFVENGVTKARRTMALKIDLGGLSSWAYGTYGGVNYFQCPVNGLKAAGPTSIANLICTRYTPRAAATSTGSGNGIATLDSGGMTYIRIFDSSMSSEDIVDGVIAKLSGVELLAEAATPIVYTDLQYADGTPFIMPQMFRTAQGGTMRIVSPDGATAPSAPFSADIIYPVDPIASSGASLKNLLEALKTATVITSYTMTFNSTTQQYEFTITQ